MIAFTLFTSRLQGQSVEEDKEKEKKIKLSKNVKKIEKERCAGMEIILTPDQMDLYDAFKEEQKASRKKK